MRISKKLLASLVCFLLTLVLVSGLILYPVTRCRMRHYRDGALRESLAGQIDCLYLGASQSITAFRPQIIDGILGTSSYNLSAQMMDLDSRLYLLEKELARNPVEHVVLEISQDTLCRDPETEYAEGTAITVQRLDSMAEALDFMGKHVSVNDWLNIYSRLLATGLSQWLDLLRGSPRDQVDAEARGFYPRPTGDVRLTDPAAVTPIPLELDYRQENRQQVLRLLELCREKGARVTVVVLPLPDSFLWGRTGWDRFHGDLETFCAEQGCEFYDFNLLKDRYVLFSDRTCFYDSTHMSSDGAAVFSKTYAMILQLAAAGAPVDTCFYETYEQMLADSPYAADRSA